jgi:hypothetical protein
MEIKLKLDTEKASKTTIAIAAAYGLCRVSADTKYPQLAAANTIVLIRSSTMSLTTLLIH